MPADRPLISVILPVWNAARYLRAALDSITAQTLADFELIAVDDGSADDSLKILRRHAARDPRLRVITRPNTGIVGALNDGLAAAAGRFVARMDADDEAAPERFARQVDRFRSDPGLVALGSAVIFMDAAGRSVQRCPRPLLHGEIERSLLAGDGGALIHPAVMFRAGAVRACGGYRVFQRDAQFFEDLDLYLRLARVGTLANLAEPLLRYRVHDGSINFTRHDARRAVKLTVLREAYAARGRPFQPEQIPESANGHGDPASHAREWAATSLAFGSRRVAVAHGWRAVWLRPRDAASWRALRFALTAPVPSPGSPR
jgi:glycosyltransferase involved in cell wall biosynthesis